MFPHSARISGPDAVAKAEQRQAASIAASRGADNARKKERGFEVVDIPLQAQFCIKVKLDSLAGTSAQP